MKPTVSPIFYATSRLAKVQPTPTELSRASDFVMGLRGKADEQAAFFAYCKQWKLAPWLCTQLQKHGLWEGLNGETQAAFQEMHSRVQTQNDNRFAEATRFLQEFEKQGIDVAILKGNFLIHSLYHDTGYKKMNDFDMLVHMEDWGRIQDIFFGLDYIPLGFGWSGEKQEPTKFSHTGIPFISRNYHCITGTQWGLKSPTARYTVDLDEAWAQSRDFDFYGLKLKQLSPSYNLLHLILHMGVYKCGIRDCMDVYNLLQQHPDLDEDELVDLFARSNATDKARFTLQLTDLCAEVVSPTLLEKLDQPRGGYLPRRLASRQQLVEKTGDMQHAYHDYFQDIEHTLFNFNLYPRFHQRLYSFFKLNGLIVWPRSEIMRKLSDLTPDASLGQKIQARIKAPYLVFALIAEEIGWGITMLLFAKLSVDLVMSLKNYFVKQPSYLDYLKERGVNPKDIMKAVKEIQ